MEVKPLGATGLKVPSIVFGTSSLGNLYQALSEKTKFEIIQKSIDLSQPVSVFDSAGKYGAGLALEVLGNCFSELEIPKDQVVISNKLGWVRSPLKGQEPTFEPGVWKDLKYDAVQKISYQGILTCFEEGNELLKGYIPQLVSVHDPDEYLSQAKTPLEEQKRFEDILEAYRALQELKEQGRVKGIGVGAKDWKVIPRIYEKVKLDWVMFANSLTLISHPEALLDFCTRLKKDNVGIINSAVFQSGFLVGGDYFDYKWIKPDSELNKKRFEWRSQFFDVCERFQVNPAHACIQFALSVPGVTSVALSTTDPGKVNRNIRSTQESLPQGFWDELKNLHLVADLSFI